MKIRFLGFKKTSDKILRDLDRIEELKKIANRDNYPHKLEKLKKRLTEEFKFWMAKGPSNRLTDIEKDIKTVSSLQHKKVLTTADKTAINLLVAKHPID